MSSALLLRFPITTQNRREKSGVDDEICSVTKFSYPFWETKKKEQSAVVWCHRRRRPNFLTYAEQMYHHLFDAEGTTTHHTSLYLLDTITTLVEETNNHPIHQSSCSPL